MYSEKVHFSIKLFYMEKIEKCITLSNLTKDEEQCFIDFNKNSKQVLELLRYQPDKLIQNSITIIDDLYRKIEPISNKFIKICCRHCMNNNNDMLFINNILKNFYSNSAYAFKVLMGIFKISELYKGICDYSIQMLAVCLAEHYDYLSIKKMNAATLTKIMELYQKYYDRIYKCLKNMIKYVQSFNWYMSEKDLHDIAINNTISCPDLIDPIIFMEDYSLLLLVKSLSDNISRITYALLICNDYKDYDKLTCNSKYLCKSICDLIHNFSFIEFEYHDIDNLNEKFMVIYDDGDDSKYHFYDGYYIDILNEFPDAPLNVVKFTYPLTSILILFYLNIIDMIFEYAINDKTSTDSHVIFTDIVGCCQSPIPFIREYIIEHADFDYCEVKIITYNVVAFKYGDIVKESYHKISYSNLLQLFNRSDIRFMSVYSTEEKTVDIVQDMIWTFNSKDDSLIMDKENAL